MEFIFYKLTKPNQNREHSTLQLTTARFHSGEPPVSQQLGSSALHFRAAEHLSDLHSYPLCCDETRVTLSQFNIPPLFFPALAAPSAWDPLPAGIVVNVISRESPSRTTCHTAPPLTLIPRLSSWMSFLQSTNRCAVLCTCKHVCLGFPPPPSAPPEQ